MKSESIWLVFDFFTLRRPLSSGEVNCGAWLLCSNQLLTFLCNHLQVESCYLHTVRVLVLNSYSTHSPTVDTSALHYITTTNFFFKQTINYLSSR
ncbi:uncharacterized protein YALI1_A01430g [Yarrowia lipolytica]|uniref:Uncharacterized protein n=1 Tax=Yarrowia lipolytica TaxID=4952 RepID=A0A1D8N3C1_YARLL|nr:hypothetical protein YALI1_A01430g [Yarrowia lipolytica]